MQELSRTQSAYMPNELKSQDHCQDFMINHHMNPITDAY